MQVAAAGVALPDLDGRARDRPAVEPEHAARHMGDGALGPRRAAAQHDEVAVDVGRELHRIERPRRRARRRDEPGLGGKPGRKDQRAGGGKPAGDEAAAADSRGGDQAHGFRPAFAPRAEDGRKRSALGSRCRDRDRARAMPEREGIRFTDRSLRSPVSFEFACRRMNERSWNGSMCGNYETVCCSPSLTH